MSLALSFSARSSGQAKWYSDVTSTPVVGIGIGRFSAADDAPLPDFPASASRGQTARTRWPVVSSHSWIGVFDSFPADASGAAVLPFLAAVPLCAVGEVRGGDVLPQEFHGRQQRRVGEQFSHQTEVFERLGPLLLALLLEQLIDLGAYRVDGDRSGQDDGFAVHREGIHRVEPGLNRLEEVCRPKRDRQPGDRLAVESADLVQRSSQSRRRVGTWGGARGIRARWRGRFGDRGLHARLRTGATPGTPRDPPPPPRLPPPPLRPPATRISERPGGRRRRIVVLQRHLGAACRALPGPPGEGRLGS